MTEPSRTKSIAVIGCGYVGYPLALLLADAGHTVRAVDTDPEVVSRITSGGNLLHEPGIPELAESAHATGRLTAHTTLAPADIFIISVPSPLDETGRKADLSAVKEAARSVAEHLRPGDLVIVESTVPPGTCESVIAPILDESGLKAGVDFHLAHCPERVFPGNTVEEMRSVARVVGGISKTSTDAAVDFLETFVEGTITPTNATTAELVKLMENTYRDVNIALTNQVATIAQAHSVDPVEAIRIANQHPRVMYLTPGIGVGGHCIPVDPWFLLEGTTDGGIISDARSQNDMRPAEIAKAIIAHLDEGERSVLLLGAAYKPGVSDVRNSPALVVRDHLEAAGIETDVHDPLVPQFAEFKADHATAVVLVPHDGFGATVEELKAGGVRVLDATTGTLSARLSSSG